MPVACVIRCVESQKKNKVACFWRFGSSVVYTATANAGVVQRSTFNTCTGRTWILGENRNWTERL